MINDAGLGKCKSAGEPHRADADRGPDRQHLNDIDHPESLTADDQAVIAGYLERIKVEPADKSESQKKLSSGRMERPHGQGVKDITLDQHRVAAIICSYLYSFIGAVFPIVSPSAPFKPNWHLEAIAFDLTLRPPR